METALRVRRPGSLEPWLSSRRSMWGRRFFAAVLGVLGFAVVWRVALGYAYEQQGFDPGRDILAADCDDCGITEFLDALPRASRSRIRGSAHRGVAVAAVPSYPLMSVPACRRGRRRSRWALHACGCMPSPRAPGSRQPRRGVGRPSSPASATDQFGRVFSLHMYREGPLLGVE